MHDTSRLVDDDEDEDDDVIDDDRADAIAHDMFYLPQLMGAADIFGEDSPEYRFILRILQEGDKARRAVLVSQWGFRLNQMGDDAASLLFRRATVHAKAMWWEHWDLKMAA